MALLSGADDDGIDGLEEASEADSRTGVVESGEAFSRKDVELEYGQEAGAAVGTTVGGSACGGCLCDMS